MPPRRERVNNGWSLSKKLSYLTWSPGRRTFHCHQNWVPLLTHQSLSIVAHRLHHCLLIRSPPHFLIVVSGPGWGKNVTTTDGIFGIRALALSCFSPLLFAINTCHLLVVAVPPAAATVPLHLPSPSSLPSPPSSLSPFPNMADCCVGKMGLYRCCRCLLDWHCVRPTKVGNAVMAGIGYRQNHKTP